jgi:hypothetical protein
VHSEYAQIAASVRGRELDASVAQSQATLIESPRQHRSERVVSTGRALAADDERE